MKKLGLILILFSFSIFLSAQDCSSNAGASKELCIGQLVELTGETSGGYDPTMPVVWSVVDSPIQLEFSNPNDLETEVTTVGNIPFVTYDYVFRFSFTCTNGMLAENETTVTMGEISNLPEIITPGTSPFITCSNPIEFIGSEPDENVSTLWYLETFSPHIAIIQNGNTATITHTRNISDDCDYRVIYQQKIGDCVEEDYIDIEYTESYESVTVEPSGNSCPSCGLTAKFIGTQPGCKGKGSWSVDPPNTSSIQVGGSSNRLATITFDNPGIYEITYTIENGDCPTASDTYTCEIRDVGALSLGPDEYYYSCEDTWEYELLSFSTTEIRDATYQWTASVLTQTSSSITLYDVSISDPNSHSTDIIFPEAPFSFPDQRLLVYISVTVTLENGCSDIQQFYFTYNPTIGIENEDVYLLCGGEDEFSLSDNIDLFGLGKAWVTATAIEAPDASGLLNVVFNPFNTTIDMTTCGSYQFQIIGQTDEVFEYGSELPITCFDTAYINVFVAEVLAVNAGSDINFCPALVQLNGNTPITEVGCETSFDIPVLWTYSGADPDVQIIPDNVPDPFIVGMKSGETYSFTYSILQGPDCIVEDEVMVTTKSEDECPSCELGVSIVEECADGCIQLMVNGDADEYIWHPSGDVDDSNPLMPIICNTAGGTFILEARKDGKACAALPIVIDPCEVECEIDVFVSSCKADCVQVEITGNADKYEWTPTAGLDLSDPQNVKICNPQGEVYVITGYVNGIACDRQEITLPTCSRPCEIDVFVSSCKADCVQVEIMGNADKYEWTPSAGLDLSDPQNVKICNPQGEVYVITGYVNGVACDKKEITLPTCSEPCELDDINAEVVVSYCVPHSGGNARMFDIVFPNFPNIDINDIKVESGNVANELLYFDNGGDLHYSGKLESGLGSFCFTLILDDNCFQEFCFDLPNCPVNSCDCIYFFPQSCYSGEGQFGISMNVLYYATGNGVAHSIRVFNEENVLEEDLAIFGPPNGNNNQEAGIEFYGTDFNNDGLVTIRIEILGSDGQIICEGLAQFGVNTICDNLELLNYIFAGGSLPLVSDPSNPNITIQQKAASESLLESFLVYPIPANDVIFVQNRKGEEVKVEVFNIYGKSMSQIALSSSTHISISSEEFPSDVYLIRITNAKGETIKTNLVPVIH